MDGAAAAPANTWSSKGGLLNEALMVSTASGEKMSLATTGVNSLTLAFARKSAVLCILSPELSSTLKDKLQSSTLYVR